MMFGGRAGPEESFEIIDRAIDAGLNFIDTANVYNQGRSEELVGDALRRNGHRHHIVLATKVHGNMHPGDSLDPNQVGNSRRQIVEQCEASLKRLKTEWIDLYQIHRPDPGCPIDETLRALDDLVRAGKVRYLGASTFAAWQLIESLWAAKEYGLNRFVSEQPPYNLLDRRIERELIPAATSYGFAIIPWSPLAGGFLSGKYRRTGQQPEGRFADGTHVRAPAAARQLAGLRCSRGVGGPSPREGDPSEPIGSRLDGATARHHEPDHWTANTRATRRQS
jgi:aryl-alcohol dehydrogenase-like predicted oxidoreductase